MIGADGVRSTIASAVDAPVEVRGVAATAVTYGYWTDVAADDVEWIYGRAACAGVLPTADGQAGVFAATPLARCGAASPRCSELVALASPSLARRLAAGSGPTDVRGGGGRAGFLRRPTGPGWALVGGAGAWTDPVGGHGLTEALRDAELLATALIDGASGEQTEAAPSPTSTPRATASLDRSSTSSTPSPASPGPTTRSPAGCVRLRSAMSDEVEALDGLAHLSQSAHQSPLMNGARR